jgi:hypothetical protein
MNFDSQLPELHYWTCRSLWDLTCITFLYRWLSLCFTSSTLTVRSVPTGYTGRVFHALRGKHSALQATSHHRLTRCPSLSAMAFPIAEWSSLSYHTRTTPTGSTWVLSTGIYHSRGRWVSHPQSADRLLWPQPHCGSSLSVWIVSCCESSRPGMVGPYGSPTGAFDASRAVW